MAIIQSTIGTNYLTDVPGGTSPGVRVWNSVLILYLVWVIYFIRLFGLNYPIFEVHIILGVSVVKAGIPWWLRKFICGNFIHHPYVWSSFNIRMSQKLLEMLNKYLFSDVYQVKEQKWMFCSVNLQSS